MTKYDYLIICNVYIEIISDRQCYVLYNMINNLTETFIPGTMPYGEHFWYTHETMLDAYMWNELKGKDLKDGAKTIVMVFICKILLREEGIK